MIASVWVEPARESAPRRHGPRVRRSCTLVGDEVVPLRTIGVENDTPQFTNT
jgi:hypothetical protein